MNTRTRISNLCLAISGTFLLSQAGQAVTTNNGDLLIGFYQVVGGSVTANTYVLNLGKASLYRENTQSNVAVSVVNPDLASANIAADLEDAFGPGWAEDGTVYWSVFGGADQSTSGVVDGDVLRTPYISLPVSSFVVGKSTTSPTVNSNFRGSVSNAISAIRAGANGTGAVVLGGNAAGAKIPSSGSLGTSIDSFFPPFLTPATYLSLGTDLRGTFGAGTMAGSSEHEGALDVYRYTNSITTSGVDLTSGFGGGNAALGVGQYIGTFTIDTAGNIKVYGSAPVTGSYYTFATANNLIGGPGADSDNDGINNLTEYALDTNLSGPDGSVGTFNGALLSFNKRAAAVANGDLTYAIQESDDLGVTDPWTTLAGTNSTTVVSATLPAGQPKSFARLKVTSNAVAP